MYCVVMDFETEKIHKIALTEREWNSADRTEDRLIKEGFDLGDIEWMKVRKFDVVEGGRKICK